MQKLDAIIFDMDGTLFDSSSVVPDAYRACVEPLGRADLDRQDIIDLYHLGPPPNILRHLLGREGEPHEVDSYHSHLAEQATDLRPYAGMEDLLRTLRDRDGMRLAVFTGASTHSCGILLEPGSLHEYFDELIGSDRVDAPKPAPDGLLLTCERLGVEPGRAAYVGDSILDQLAARAAGMVAVAAGWGHLFDPETDADLVAMHPGDVLRLVGD